MASKSNKNKNKKKDGVEAFEDEELDETDEDEVEDEDEDDDEDEVDEDEDESEDDEEEEDTEPVLIDAGFAPFVVSEDQEWELQEIISAATQGEAIYLYAPPDPDNAQPAKWYKLMPVEIGEVIAAQP